MIEAKAFEALTNTILAAGRARVVVKADCPGAPYLIQMPDGSTVWRTPDYPPRNYQLSGLDAVAAATVEICRRAEVAPRSEAMIFVGRRWITAIIDEGAHRVVQLSMKLTTTGVWDLLTRMEKDRRLYKQREFLDILRTDLAGCVDDDFVALIRQIRVSASSLADHEVGVGKESLGKQASLATTAGNKPIPEQISLEVNIFRDVPEIARQAVRAAVICEVAEFGLIPLPMDLDCAMLSTQEAIAGSLTDLLKLYGMEDLPPIVGGDPYSELPISVGARNKDNG